MRRARRTIRLADVPDRQGRIDVALYRIADRLVNRLEREQGVVGLRENLLPIVEDAIRAHVPAENLIPREIQALLKICELNRNAQRCFKSENFSDLEGQPEEGART